MIRRLETRDLDDWARMRSALWPDCDAAASRAELPPFLDGDKAVAFVAESAGAGVVGFIELELREKADGCDSRPVPFIEGWYVAPAIRRRGIGRQLVEAVEAWASGRGFTEIASDCELDNATSLAAHTALGYREIERAIRFRKPLDQSN